MKQDYPILEFDPSREAVIEPSQVIKPIDAPECCVICFFQGVIDKLDEEGRLKILTVLRSEIGPNPLFEMDYNENKIAIFQPGVGASLAAAFLEEVIAYGCRKFIAIGGAGVLDAGIDVGHVIIPVAAVRDEGTSYHYLPPGREVTPSKAAVDGIRQVLMRDEIPYIEAKTWTTDGIYRETPGKVKQRRAEGCLTVEMETAALFAVAHFRKVALAQMLYAGDDVSGSEWDTRDWYRREDVREKLLNLAAEACLIMK